MMNYFDLYRLKVFLLNCKPRLFSISICSSKVLMVLVYGIRGINVYKNEVPPWFAVLMGSVAESVTAKVRSSFQCNKSQPK